MTLQQKWFARCDSADCDESIVLEYRFGDSIWSGVLRVREVGWQIDTFPWPGSFGRVVHCPKHWTKP